MIDVIDPRNDQLPVALIAKMVENNTGIAEVRVRVAFRLLLKKRNTTAKMIKIKIVSIRSSNENFINLITHTHIYTLTLNK